jgi:TM2 domain-containing membrane protein YozV
MLRVELNAPAADLLGRWVVRGGSAADIVSGGGYMAGQGSAGNVIAALCSFFIPGLGQLLQGRLFMAIIQFVLAGVLWFFLLGWVIHLWSILDAALWKPKRAEDS